MRSGAFAARADHLVVVCVADEDDAVVLPGIALHFQVHLGDQGTGSVKDVQLLRRGFGPDAGGDAVGAEDGGGARRDGGDFVDKYRALLLKSLDHVAVVHDLLAHVNRLVEDLQRLLDDVNGPVHPGTKAARLGQDQPRQCHVHTPSRIAGASYGMSCSAL